MDVFFQESPDTLEPQTGRSTAGVPAPLMRYSPRPLEGTAVDTLCRCVRYLFDSCNDHSSFQSEEARRRRMHTCVEVAASLVCGIGFQLEWLGEIGKLVSEIGHIENINQSPTSTPDPSFIVRWTCLSLVAIHQILGSNLLRVSAGYAVSGLARFQPDYGPPEEVARRSAQRIEECLKTAWERVEELRQALKPSTQRMTSEQVKDILRKHERQVSELERLKVEVNGIKDVDWRISLYQAAMDQATFRLARQLPGVSFDEPCQTESFLISDTFKIPASGSTTVTPQLILPGQQVQALARLGLKLREILDGQADEGYEEVLENLKSVDQIPVSLRRPNGLMKRQLWRLQDLRDGGGLGFAVELFFLVLKQLLSIPSLHESNCVFYIGTFKIIASHWEESKKSPGTHHTLLNILCELIIRDRGVFSNFSYPEPITTVLVEMVSNMLQGMLQTYADPDEDIRDLLQEIVNVDPSNCMDRKLQQRALTAIPPSRYFP
jgi:DNA-directed RNA polymerase subunit L